MLKIGITGGIGSGKTTVCKIFEMLGTPIFYADAVAHNMVDNNNKVIHNIIRQFGANMYSFGKLDRKKMADLVFNDKKKLEQLNAIIHPAVAASFDLFCEEHSASAYILKEAAILFETGLNNQLDSIIVVSSPDEIRIERVIKRDKITKSEVEIRMKNQMPQEEKIKMADFTIDNSGKVLVIPQVLNIHKTLMK